MPIQVAVRKTKSGPELTDQYVTVPGVEELTPFSARTALELAYGKNYDGEVWWTPPEGAAYGYRVYQNSARMLHPEPEE